MFRLGTSEFESYQWQTFFIEFSSWFLSFTFKHTKTKIQILQYPFEEAEKWFEEWWNYRRGYHSTQMEESVQR